MKSVYYTNWFIPSGMDAFTPGPFTFIRPSHKDDRGLHVHEEVHRLQCKHLGWPRYIWRYLFSKTRRLDMEVEAYKAQIAMGDITLERASDLLATGYRLAISVDEAKRRLA